MNLTSGWKTYAAAGVIVAVVVLEKALNIDVPGVVLADDWLTALLTAAGLGSLRHAIGKAPSQ